MTQISKAASAAQPTAMTTMTAIQRLQAAAAAKYSVQNNVTTETSAEQTIKDLTRKVLAGLTLTQAVNIVNAIPDIAENVDVDKTATKLLLNAKKELTIISKTLQESAVAGIDIDLTGLQDFSMGNTKVELVTYELPPLYKGALVAIDWNSISSDAKEKLILIGITAEEPFAILTALSYDKSANNVFIKVGSFDLTKGTVRLSLKFTALVPDVNGTDVVEAYNAKIEELKSNITDAKTKISEKQFSYVADKILTPTIAAKFGSLLAEGYTPEQLTAFVQSISLILKNVGE